VGQPVSRPGLRLFIPKPNYPLYCWGLFALDGYRLTS
jgi:hypothetical protein